MRLDLTKTSTYFTVLLAVVAGGAALFFLNRGFDFTDEGFYYLHYAYPEDLRNAISLYHLPGSFLLMILHHQITLMRLSVLLATGVAASLWAASLLPLLKDLSLSRTDRLAVLALLFLSILQTYAISPVAWSYNFLTFLLSLAVYGILFYFFRRGEKIALKSWLAGWLCIACLVEGLFFVKFGSSFVMLLLLSMLLPVMPGISWRQKMIAALCLGGWIFGSAVAYFVFVQPFGEWRHMMTINMSIVSSPVGMTQILYHYARDLAGLAAATATKYGIAIVLQGLVLFCHRQWPAKTAPSTWLSRLVWVVFLGEAWYDQAYKNTIWLAFSGHSLDFFLAFACIAICQLARSGVKQKRILALLFCFPFLGAIGTTNPLVLNLVFGSSGWVAFLLLLAAQVSGKQKTLSFLRFSMLGLSLVLTSQFFYGYVLHPYGNQYFANGLAPSLLKQSEQVKVGDSLLLLDPERQKFLVNLRQILQEGGYQQGDDLLGLFDMPGIVYAMGGRSPGIAWYFDVPSMAYRNLHSLQGAGVDRTRHAFVLLRGNKAKATELLQGAGLAFPTQYEYLGTVMIPYINTPLEVWKPFTP